MTAMIYVSYELDLKPDEMRDGTEKIDGSNKFVESPWQLWQKEENVSSNFKKATVLRLMFLFPYQLEETQTQALSREELQELALLLLKTGFRELLWVPLI